MEKYINEIKAAAAAAVGVLTGLWGWLGWLVVGWVACMVMDYLSGSAAACKGGAWSSAKARDGIWHKAGMIVVVIVAAGADWVLSVVLAHLPLVELPVRYSGLVCPVVLVWYIVTELGSIIENAAAMGAPVPAWLKKLIAAARDAADKAGGGLTGEDGNGPD